MGQTIGTTQTQKLSEDIFSCEWHFCKVNFDFAYKSSPCGFMHKELSNCYLEMKPNIMLRVLTFYLCGYKGQKGSKITSKAVLTDGTLISRKSNEYDACLDLESSVKIFEINLSDPMLKNCYDYIFKLEIQLHSYSTYMQSIFNENTSLQSYQNNGTIPTSFNEETTDVKCLEYRISSSTEFNEDSTYSKNIEHSRASSSTSNEKVTYKNDLNNINPHYDAFNKELKGTDRLHITETFSTTYTKEPIDTKCLSDNSTTFSVHSKVDNKLEYTKELVEDLRSLHTSGDMCDMKIRIGEDVFRVHKLILSARSRVFRQLMKDSSFESPFDNTITITDCSVPAFKKFLNYLYTGEIENSTIETMISLYSLGKKYYVSALPEACSDILQSKICFESEEDVATVVCDVLQFAECHRDSKLKEIAVNFIAQHFPVVSSKQSWKDFMKSNSELTSNILAIVAASLQKSEKLMLI